TLTPLDLYKTLRVVFALSPEDSYSPVSGQKLVFEIQSRLEAKQPSQTITTPEQAAASVDALAADISASFQGTEFPISKDQVAGLINASVAVVENLNAETFANNLTAAQLQSISSVANRAGFQNEGLDAQAATAFVLSTEKQAIKVSVGLGVDLANTALQDVGAAIEAKLNGLSAQDAQVFAANSGMTVDQAKLLAQATTGLGAAKVMSGQVFDSLYGVRNVDMRPGDRGAVTTADIPPTASTQGGEGAPASVVQDRLRGVGIQLGVELVSGTPEEIQKGLDARLAEIRQEILSDLQKSAGRTRYADQNEKRYEGVFKAKYGVSPDDLRNAVMADVRTLHDMKSKTAIDEKNVAAMDTLSGNFCMVDMTQGADFLKDSDD
ncbi:MAG: hypothetical protein KDA77_22970, partial [Planctomycetaceae bacterium]|nr:hypothetical protein [Planctomycetaceae bacterium]